MKNRKFQNKRFITFGVSERIPEELQVLLWLMADGVEEQDYLQIFELHGTEEGISIVHKQEVPPYENHVQVHGAKLTQSYEKVYIIDDETHSTMLLAEEY